MERGKVCILKDDHKAEWEVEGQAKTFRAGKITHPSTPGHIESIN